MTFLILTNSF